MTFNQSAIRSRTFRLRKMRALRAKPPTVGELMKQFKSRVAISSKMPEAGIKVSVEF